MPIAKLHSIQSKQESTLQNNWKILHFIRHAEGTHNVNKDYKNPANLDAQLTAKGIQQCRDFAVSKNGCVKDVECIITSPMARAIQTANYCFEEKIFSTKKQSSLPMIAFEEWRETVNYTCDKRRNKSIIQKQFPHVDFCNIQSEEDPIWLKYESIHGSADVYRKHRESIDNIGLEDRIRAAWNVIKDRPEDSIAIVSHSAFFMQMFNPPYSNLKGLVHYCDEDVATLMQSKFENCECRSVLFELI